MRFKDKNHCPHYKENPVILHVWEFRGYYANLPLSVRENASWLSWNEIDDLLREAEK